MKCGHCGAPDPNIYLSETFHADYGLIQEWACQKCGSRNIEGVKGMATKIGTCENCQRPNLSLQSIKGEGFYCGTCRNVVWKYPAGPEREKALFETRKRLNPSSIKGTEEALPPGMPPSPPPPSETKSQDPGPVSGSSHTVPKDEQISVTPVDTSAGASVRVCPLIVLTFETERDTALYYKIVHSADIARNENVSQHVLHLLEKALGLST